MRTLPNMISLVDTPLFQLQCVDGYQYGVVICWRCQGSGKVTKGIEYVMRFDSGGGFAHLQMIYDWCPICRGYPPGEYLRAQMEFYKQEPTP